MSESLFHLVVGFAPDPSGGDLEALLEAGVAEVFAGYVPQRWLARYGAETSPNRRYLISHQILDRGTLFQIAQRVRGAGVNFTVALNEHYHPPDSGDLLDEIVNDSLAAGATGFIAADLETFNFLRPIVPAGTALILSNEAAAFNAEAALRYTRAGATRVIFPREMKVSEMEALASALAPAGVSLEAFIAREYCPNSSSLCYTVHGFNRPAYFCHAHERLSLLDLRGKNHPRDIAIWPAGLPAEPGFSTALAIWHRCGLCAIRRLGSIGVRYLKIPGRCSSALPAVRAIRALMDGGDLSEAACRKTIASAAFCAGGRHCYYDLADVRSGRCPNGVVSRLQAASSPTPSDDAMDAPGLGIAVALHPEACTASELARLRGGVSALAAEGQRLAPWEQSAMARTLDVLEERGVDITRAPSRVLLDCEACLLRWPEPRALVEQIGAIVDEGFEAALVLPVVFQSGWREVWNGLETLVKAELHFAIIANDLGMIEAAGRLGRPVETGRIWNRMKRDQFAYDPSVLPLPIPGAESDLESLKAVRTAQLRAEGTPYIVHGAHGRLLREKAIRRAGFDVLATPLSAPLDPAFAYSFWCPWTYVTSSRACVRAVELEGASSAHPTARCRRGCVDEALVYHYLWRHAATIRHGASLFVDTSADLQAFLDSASTPRAEIVLTPRVPR